MSDHSSVQEAETAAAGKVREMSEAAIRLLLRQRQQSTAENKQSTAENKQSTAENKQPQAPTDKHTKLFDDFYQAYRDRGVDRETAKAAAADAALGLGSQDSGMMQQAEAQIVKKAQQAEQYRTAVNTAANESNPVNVRLQAARESKDLETGLGITGKTPTEKAETINQYEPEARAQEAQASVQLEPTQSMTGTSQTAREALRQDYQNGYEQQGARPETAKAASHEVVNQAAGASDGPAVAQAHQEIRQHQVLKDMYQGVFEKNGVSPEVASQAADQMARGNGAAQSPEVRKAHDQALANIGKAQQISTAPAQQPAVEKNGANQSPEARQVASPIPTNAPQSAPSTEVAKPIPKAQRNQASRTQPVQSKPTPKVERPIQAAAAQFSDSLWQRHSPTEQGTGTSGVDYKSKPELGDKRFAYNALSAGASKADIQQSIIHNSPEAGKSANPKQYADQTISEVAQRLSAALGQQLQTRPATTMQSGAAEQKATGQAKPVKPQPSRVAVRSSQLQVSTSNRDAVEQNASSQKPATAQSQPVAEVTQPAALEQRLTSKEIYSKFSEAEGTGVFARMSKKNARVNDLAVAQKAIAAGIDINDIEAAIAENSPHAQTLRGADIYAKRTVGKAQKVPGRDLKETQADQGQKSEKGQSREKARRPKDQTRANQSGKKTVAQRQKTQKKVKSKSRGQGMEM